MRSGRSDENDSEFLKNVDEVIREEKAFLEEIGKL